MRISPARLRITPTLNIVGRALGPQGHGYARIRAVLIATLESLPKTPAEPYWICTEAGFANLVMQTEDPRAWRALEKVAKRSDVGVRMEFMDPMNYIYIC